MMFTRLAQALIGGRLGAKRNAIGVIAVAFLLGLAPSGFSDDPQETPGVKGKTISSKGEDRTLATSINFAKDLGLSFDSLISLGTRIEQATKAADPVGLASLASELSVYERVSGKTAKITSAAIIKEAVDLAEVRDSSAELRAVAHFVKDEETAKRLVNLAEVAAKREDAGRRAFESGERTRGIARNLYVHNNTQYQIFIFEDGRQLGWVNPWGDYQYYVGHGPNQNSVFWARSADGSRMWPPNGRVIVDYTVQDYTWTLD